MALFVTEMICYTVTLLPILLTVLASSKSTGSYESTTGDSSAKKVSILAVDQRNVENHSNVRRDDHLFISPEKSTLPPVMASAAKTDEKKVGSADKKVGRSRWTNEIVRQRSFTDNNRDGETENASTGTTRQLNDSEPSIRRQMISKGRVGLEVRRSNTGVDTTVGEDVTELPQRDRDVINNRTQHRPGYDAVTEEMSNDATAVENSDEVEPTYDDDAEYDEVDEDYEDVDGDVQYYDDDSKTVDEQEDDETDEQRVSNKESVGREAVHYQEYEISADSSRGIDFDATNAEVINEVRIVEQPVRRQRRKGRPRTSKKTRSRTRKRRRKRPPIEPVGPVEKPSRTRQRTSAGTRRRKVKARRRHRGQIVGERRRRKNRRNKQTISVSGGNRNVNTFEHSDRRPEAAELTIPHQQQLSLIHSLQQQYQQQQQQQNRYDGQYYVPRYVDVHDGRDRRRIVSAATAAHGQTSQQTAANRGDHSSVNGRVPPVSGYYNRPTAQQTSPKPRLTFLEGHYFNPRQYHQQLQQNPHHQYYNHRYHRHQQQQQQQQQRPQHPRQYYQSYYQQQPPPTYSRHQQQIHFILPTSDFDLRRIPQVMSALGLDYIGGSQPTSAGQPQIHQHPSSNFGAYREGYPVKVPANKNLDDEESEMSLSRPGLSATDDAVERRHHLRYQRSTNGRSRALNTTEEGELKAAYQHSGRPAKMQDRSEDVADDDDDEYVDNSDIEITTRSPGIQTTALGPV